MPEAEAVQERRPTVEGLAADQSATPDSPEQLFRELYPRLAGWCRRMIGDDDVAHDIASEAFTRLLGRWTAVDNPHAYLYTTAMNLIRDRWRSSERERTGIRVLAAAQSTSQSTSAEPVGPELRMLVESLPKQLRRVVTLYYYADLPIDEIAGVLGIAPGTVKSHLYDARARLAKLLEPN